MLTYSGKVDRIRQVVHLKQILKRWRSLSLSGQRHETSRRPNKTPAGCLAVYVGVERRRFVIPTSYLNLPVFAALLQQSEEEIGYQSAGALVLPCDVAFFASLLRALAKKEKAFASLSLDDALQLLSADSPSFCKQPNASLSSPPGKGFRAPLLQKSSA